MTTSNHTTKQCNRCGDELIATPDYFYRQSNYKDGLRPICKICDNFLRKNRIKSENPDRFRPLVLESDIQGVLKIPLTKGFVALIDECDRDLASNRWHSRFGIRCYAVQRIDKNLVLLHRLIVSRIMGRDIQKDEVVDHINGDSLDNRRVNLRLVTAAQNSRNRKRNSLNTSGLKGASFDRKTGKWLATIKLDGKTIYLGKFPTVEEAHDAYVAGSIKYHGEFGSPEYSKPTDVEGIRK